METTSLHLVLGGSPMTTCCGRAVSSVRWTTANPSHVTCVGGGVDAEAAFERELLTDLWWLDISYRAGGATNA